MLIAKPIMRCVLLFEKRTLMDAIIYTTNTGSTIIRWRILISMLVCDNTDILVGDTWIKTQARK